jgi:hypothetical protein
MRMHLRTVMLRSYLDDGPRPQDSGPSLRRPRLDVPRRGDGSAAGSTSLVRLPVGAQEAQQYKLA